MGECAAPVALLGLGRLARLGESGKPGREVFSRSVKSIVFSGPRGSDYDRTLGLDLEILVRSDPATWRPDGA